MLHWKLNQPLSQGKAMFSKDISLPLFQKLKNSKYFGRKLNKEMTKDVENHKSIYMGFL